MNILELYLNQIHALCQINNVSTLYAFGSVNTTNFSDTSDIDLIVDIETENPLEYSHNYFNLKFGLEEILNRNIDLLESKSIKNPYLKQNIERTKVLIYG